MEGRLGGKGSVLLQQSIFLTNTDIPQHKNMPLTNIRFYEGQYSVTSNPNPQPRANIFSRLGIKVFSIQTYATKGTILRLRLTSHANIFLRKGILGTTTKLVNSSFGCKLPVQRTRLGSLQYFTPKSIFT